MYLPADDGNVWIFESGKEKKQAGKVDMEDGIKAAPVVANGTLYLVTSKRLFAIGGK